MTPHRCPVCNGRGKMPTSFYSTPVLPQVATSAFQAEENCRSCSGTSIVWEPFRFGTHVPACDIPQQVPPWLQPNTIDPSRYATSARPLAGN